MRFAKNITAVLCAAVCMLGCAPFSSCGSGETVGGVKMLESDTLHVVIEATETKGSLYDAMSALQTAGWFTFEGTEGQYGFFITSVNGNEPEGNSYWAVYTSLGNYGGAVYSDAQFGTYDYNGIVCASASYGCSGLPLVAGCFYVLALAEY